MAGFITSLLEGQNLVEFQQMAQDGDPKHLGTVGRNLTLIAINERARTEAAIAGAAADAEQRIINAENSQRQSAARDEAYAERLRTDREKAMERTGFRALPEAQRAALVPDSDESVDYFLRNLI